jgi:hypothetical protein
MTTKHKVVHNGRTIGIVYISPHPEFTGHKVGSIIPMARRGKWADNTSAIIFENPVHDICPDSTPDDKIIEILLGEAAIEPWKVTIVPDSLV